MGLTGQCTTLFAKHFDFTKVESSDRAPEHPTPSSIQLVYATVDLFTL
jgi:hypothetical protein